jgi:hypothetical protein
MPLRSNKWYMLVVQDIRGGIEDGLKHRIDIAGEDGNRLKTWCGSSELLCQVHKQM